MNNFSEMQTFVGCDVSKDTLDFAIYSRSTDYRGFEHIQVANDRDGFRAMLKWLRATGAKLSETVVGFEHTGFYSVALAEWLHSKKIAFCALHPLDVKSFNTRGRNKTDDCDSRLIADYVYTMREKLQPSRPEPPYIRKLRGLRNERDLVVRCRTALMNQRKTVDDATSQKRIQRTVDHMSEQVRSIEAEIKKVISKDGALERNFRLLLTIPGIGLVNAVSTIIATGNFTRFQTSRQYAKFCCVSPLSNQSGTSVNSGDHVSKKGHNELKSALTEAARSAIHCDAQLRDYYQRKRAEGKSHGCVLNAVKFKLVCRMFAVISRQSAYVNTDKYRSRTA